MNLTPPLCDFYVGLSLGLYKNCENIEIPLTCVGVVILITASSILIYFMVKI